MPPPRCPRSHLSPSPSGLCPRLSTPPPPARNRDGSTAPMGRQPHAQARARGAPCTAGTEEEGLPPAVAPRRAHRQGRTNAEPHACSPLPPHPPLRTAQRQQRGTTATAAVVAAAVVAADAAAACGDHVVAPHGVVPAAAAAAQHQTPPRRRAPSTRRYPPPPRTAPPVAGTAGRRLLWRCLATPSPLRSPPLPRRRCENSTPQGDGDLTSLLYPQPPPLQHEPAAKRRAAARRPRQWRRPTQPTPCIGPCAAAARRGSERERGRANACVAPEGWSAKAKG